MSDDIVERVLDADVLKEIQEYGISLDANIIYLEGGDDAEDRSEVSWSMARRFRKNLNILAAEIIATEEAETSNIVVEIDTPGGDEQAGMSIHDSVRACKVTVIGHVTGQASSMGCVILQAFKDRVLDPSASVMYHSGTAHLYTGGQEFPSAADYTIAYSKRVDEVVYVRMLEKNPTLSRDQFDLMVMKGFYLDANQAIDLGLADRIAHP